MLAHLHPRLFFQLSDTGYFVRFGGSWVANPGNTLSAYFDYQVHENPDFLIYDYSKMKFTIQYSRAFPDVRNATKNNRKFYETSTASEVF